MFAFAEKPEKKEKDKYLPEQWIFSFLSRQQCVHCFSVFFHIKFLDEYHATSGGHDISVIFSVEFREELFYTIDDFVCREKLLSFFTSISETSTQFYYFNYLITS